MSMLKSIWLDKVAHIHSQSAAWFLFFCIAVVCVGIWWGMREDKKGE